MDGILRRTTCLGTASAVEGVHGERNQRAHLRADLTAHVYSVANVDCVIHIKACQCLALGHGFNHSQRGTKRLG